VRKASLRIKKVRGDPVEKFACSIIPPEQFAKGGYEPRDVANHNEKDQRHMVRSGETKTIYNRRASLMDDWVESEPFNAGHIWVAHQCRRLWELMRPPTWRVVDGEGEQHAQAAEMLATWKRKVGRRNWYVFENAMRWNEPGGFVGSRFARLEEENIVATKLVVKKVLEEISQ
jgi:hypothetical protein